MDSGAITVVAVLAAGTAFGIKRMLTDGRVNLHTGSHHVSADELGHDMGSKATVIQFSSPFCQPCKATHDLISNQVADRDGVVHVDLQVADHLDMVNKLHVMRTPTTVLVDRKGAVRYRTDGVPRLDEFTAAIDKLTNH